MAILLAQVRFRRTSLLEEDVVMNTFHFDAFGAPTAADFTSILDRLVAMYTTPKPGGSANYNTLSSPALTVDGHTIRIYDRTDPSPRPVRAERAFSLGPRTSNQPFPSEVALVGTMRANPIAGVPPGQLRGRVYFGPFQAGTSVGTVVEGDARPSTALQTLIAEMLESLLLPTGSVAPHLAVYSRVTNQARRVTSVSCDNSWDTQRSRGVAPTARIVRPSVAV